MPKTGLTRKKRKGAGGGRMVTYRGSQIEKGERKSKKGGDLLEKTNFPIRKGKTNEKG